MNKTKAQQITRYLLGKSSEAFDLSALEDSEVLGIGLAVFSHRRLIRTLEVNEFFREFRRRGLHRREEDFEAWKVFQEMDKALEREVFNFRESEVVLETSQDVIEALKKKTLKARVSSEKIQGYLQKNAREVVSRVREFNSLSTLTEEDVISELQCHLLEQAEEKYNPAIAAYATFAYSVLDKKAKSLIKSYCRDLNVISCSTSPDDDEDRELCVVTEPRVESKLAALSELQVLLEDFSPLARFKKFCHNLLEMNVEEPDKKRRSSLFPAGERKDTCFSS